MAVFGVVICGLADVIGTSRWCCSHRIVIPKESKKILKESIFGATNDSAVAKLVKAWESKNARRALRGSSLGLMAVSLAACGGSDSTDDVEEPTPVVSLATMVASDDLPDVYDVAVASADLGTLSLATVENVSGEIAGAENAAEFDAALAAGTIAITFSVADTLENADDLPPGSSLAVM